MSSWRSGGGRRGLADAMSLAGDSGAGACASHAGHVPVPQARFSRTVKPSRGHPATTGISHGQTRPLLHPYGRMKTSLLMRAVSKSSAQ